MALRSFRVVVLPLLAALAFASGCTLRPTYRSVVPQALAQPSTLRLLLVDAAGAPLKGVKVEVGEFKNRLTVVTDAEGVFVLPVEKKYFDENPVLAVNVPAGVTSFQVKEAPLPKPPPAPVEAPVPPRETAP
jgi:hypothetical protein